MNKFFVICALLSVAYGVNAGEKSTLQTFEGVWEGFGKQNNSSHWTIKVTISPERYLIEYPSLKCGGMLELIKQNQDSLVFQETLTYGLDNCISHGKTVLIKASENIARYYWYHENGGKKAAGKLVRQVFLPKKSESF